MADRINSDALTAALAGAALYVQLLPPLGEVRRAATDSETARDVRTGFVYATAALVGVGALISYSDRNPRPLWLTAAMAVLLGAVYVTALARPGAPAVALPGAAPATPSRWAP